MHATRAGCAAPIAVAPDGFGLALCAREPPSGPFEPLRAPFRSTLGLMEYVLDSGEELHLESPDTFHLPSRVARETLLPGELVKLIFRISTGTEVHIERMWVCIQSRTETGYVGSLDNDPYCTDELRSGASIAFGPEHVIQIYEPLHEA